MPEESNHAYETLDEIVKYMWDTEKKDYEESREVDLDEVDLDTAELDRNHIFYWVNELRKNKSIWGKHNA